MTKIGKSVDLVNSIDLTDSYGEGRIKSSLADELFDKYGSVIEKIIRRRQIMCADLVLIPNA